MRELILVGAAAEVLIAALAVVLAGPFAMAAALVGAGIALGSQIVAVALLKPAMRAATPEFTKRWVSGIGIRFAGFLVIAVLLLAVRDVRDVLPPAWIAAGYLSMMLLTLFGEARFLK